MPRFAPGSEGQKEGNAVNEAEAVGVEVWSGGVNTWECDEMGHMNVRFYVAKTMEGLGVLASMLGMTDAFSQRAEATVLMREQHIRFLKEAHAGAALYMTGGVLEMGTSDARLLFVSRHLDGSPAASIVMQVVHATSRDLQPFPWSRQTLERAAALKVVLPAYAGPRTLGGEPLQSSTASLQRADLLGLRRIGLGLIGPQECDVFGRMRPEAFIGRVSDGIPRLIGRRPLPEETTTGATRIGGAALEYRLVHLAWPRPGDLVELRSGCAWAGDKVRRLVHWVLDPQTGAPWATAEAIAANLDLDARKLLTLTPQAVAAAQAEVVADLAL